jgi:hypothetical protein
MKTYITIIVIFIIALINNADAEATEENKLKLTFSEIDIARIIICECDSVVGLDLEFNYSNAGEDIVLEEVQDVRFYLRPLGVSIKKKETIKKLIEGVKLGQVTNTSTFSGVLCYQVFLGKNNKILLTTKLENSGEISIINCFISKEGIITFNDKKQNIHFVSDDFYKIIYAFMKEYFPERIPQKYKSLAACRT